MDIHVFTPEGEFLHTENLLTTSLWTVKYDAVGTVELHTDTKNDIVPVILPVNHSDVIVVQDNHAAWIHGGTDATRPRHDFMVNGQTLECMLEWRAVDPFTATDTIENIIRSKVTEAFITPGNKRITNFTLAAPLGDTSSVTYEFADKQKTLLEVVQELCRMDGLGFRVNFDIYSGKFEFELYRGIDMTTDQTDVPPLLLSEVLRNFQNTVYVFNQRDYRSCGYMKQTNESTHTVYFTEVAKDDGQGFYRREKILLADNDAEAAAELADAKITEQIEGDLIGEALIVPDLGDMITVQKPVGNRLIVQNKRISEIIYTHEKLNSSIRPILTDIEEVD